jgi:hypothetical protein
MSLSRKLFLLWAVASVAWIALPWIVQPHYGPMMLEMIRVGAVSPLGFLAHALGPPLLAGLAAIAVYRLLKSRPKPERSRS